MRTWMGWSARHKWVSRSLARDEWIARTSDDQIVSNVTACKLALTTRALDYLTANDGADFLRAALALSLHFPPMQRVADVSERIEDLSDIPDADIERMKEIRDTARAKNEQINLEPNCRQTPVNIDPTAGTCAQRVDTAPGKPRTPRRPVRLSSPQSARRASDRRPTPRLRHLRRAAAQQAG